jgi:hypothetical protein
MDTFPSKLSAFYDGGPKTTAEAFPPACLRTHWDPTMVVKHVLPDFYAAQPLDPRPATKVCFAYHHTSAGDAPLPAQPPPSVPSTPPQFLGGLHRPEPPHLTGKVWPPGGAAELGFPYRGFKPDVETDVLRIDEPLTKCAEKRYIPPNGTPAARDFTNVVEGSTQPSPPEVLGGPHAGCREADEAEAWARSDRLFFNPTKYDRTMAVPPGVRQASSRHALPYPNKPAY